MPLQWSGISFMGIYTKKEAFKRLPYIVGKRRLFNFKSLPPAKLGINKLQYLKDLN